MLPMAAEPIEVRMARLEGAYEQIDRRLGNVESALQAVRAELHQEISSLRRESRQQFFWLLVVLVVSVLLQIASR